MFIFVWFLFWKMSLIEIKHRWNFSFHIHFYFNRQIVAVPMQEMRLRFQNKSIHFVTLKVVSLHLLLDS